MLDANGDMRQAEPIEDVPTINTGSLIVFVLDAGGALPVAGARVRIYHSGDMGGEPIAELISGENGKTEAIYLPTPPVSISDIPDRSPGVFELYDIVVSLDGYFDVVSRNIPVYPQVLSIQPVYMVPMTRLGGQNPGL